MEPIQDDIETIRGVLNYLDQFRTLEPQHEERNEALAALDRLVAERDRLLAERDRRLIENGTDYTFRENERLVAGIGALVEKWRYPHITHDQTHYSPMDMMSWCADKLEALTKEE